MNPHISVITLGVRNLSRAKKFYAEGLGWSIQQEDYTWVCFSLAHGSSALALFPWDELADDAGVPADGSGFRGMTLSCVVRSEERVDSVLAESNARVARSSDRHDAHRGADTVATSLILSNTYGR